MRPVDDASYVMVEFEFASMREAEAFRGALRALWDRVEGGLIQSPKARIVEAVESGDC